MLDYQLLLALAASVWPSTWTSRASASNVAALPIIDLGYERHQALAYNSTYDYYTFSNIRYAQPPVGDLRFRAPLKPKIDRSAVQNGSTPRTCPQAVNDWLAPFLANVGPFSTDQPFNLSAWEATIIDSPIKRTDYNQLVPVTEDCLFLDVYVPRKVLERAGPKLKGAAVMAWIHGGGFTLGSKTGVPAPQYVPSGLLAHGQNGLIVVGINYRLGALGWLGGPEVAADGTQNAGLHDQRLALEWVQEKIHLFGGDRRRVTIMGESAGGGSVGYQALAYGGKRGPPPFAQMVAQSPALAPCKASNGSAAVVTRDLLARLNVTTLAEARKVPAQTLIDAQTLQIETAPASRIGTGLSYRPVVDNDFVPAPSSLMLANSAFEPSLRVLTGQNSNEGLIFYDHTVKTEADFRRWLDTTYSDFSAADRDYLESILYPPLFDGSLGYVDQATRQATIFADALLNCNNLYLNEAFGQNSYAYEFGVSPGLHIQDLSYTFNVPATVPYPAARETLQSALVSFARTGVPSGGGIRFPKWGVDRRVVNITAAGSAIGGSPNNATRCAWWLKPCGIDASRSILLSDTNETQATLY